MKNFLRTHTNTILVVLVVLFLGVIIGYFTWGIGYIVAEVTQANTGKVASATQSSFNLQGADQINYRGIATSSASAPTAPAATPISVVTSTSATVATSTATSTAVATSTAKSAK